jgi:hypothetical protein
MTRFRLPGFIRHKVALFLVQRSPEFGGMLYDFKNGQWEVLHQWVDERGQEEALSLIENMFDGGRDAIYTAMVKTGIGRGYFVVHTSDRYYWFRGFWTGIYELDEAFLDTAKKCREIADKMGYRRPE